MAPYLRLLLAQVAIGAAAIFARFALTGTGPLAASALRLVVAAVGVVLFATLAQRGVAFALRTETSLAVAGAILAAHFAVWLTSLQYTSVAVSTLLVCTSPIWTELYEWAVLRRAMRTQFGIALLFGGVGLALVLNGRDVPAPIPGKAVLGDGLALAGGMAMGAYLLVVRGTRESVRSGAIQITDIVLRTYAWAALLLCAASLLAHESPPPLENVTAWFGILAMALVSQLIGHTLLNAALRDFPPSTVAMSTLLEPVAAAFLAALIFREAATPLTALGGASILIAIGFATR